MKSKPHTTLKLLIVFMTLLGLSFNGQSQNIRPDDHFWRHVRYGGGIGLSFGNGFFSGTLAPSAIYEFNPQFAMGVGLSGTYNKLKNRYSSTVLGGSVISLFNPFSQLQLSAEFEEMNVNRTFEYDGSDLEENYWYPALFLGAGYRTGNVSVGIRYDVLYDENKSIYADPWAPFVRVYF